MIKEQIQSAITLNMKAGNKNIVTTLRTIMAGIKQVEVDKQTTLNDGDTLSVLQKLIKQRQESAKIYRDAGRIESAEKEENEIGLIRNFMPPTMTDDEIRAVVIGFVSACDIKGTKAMGVVINQFKEAHIGQDMANVSKIIKEELSKGV